MKCRHCAFTAENRARKDGSVALGADAIARHVRTAHPNRKVQLRQKTIPADLVHLEAKEELSHELRAADQDERLLRVDTFMARSW